MAFHLRWDALNVRLIALPACARPLCFTRMTSRSYFLASATAKPVGFHVRCGKKEEELELVVERWVTFVLNGEAMGCINMRLSST